jgi:hypothetical protein
MDIEQSMAYRFVDEQASFQEQAVTPAQHITTAHITFSDGSFVMINDGEVLRIDWTSEAQ